jgi:peptide/nickel transport system substrate-binding protein
MKYNKMVAALALGLSLACTTAQAGKAQDTLNVALELDIESMDLYMTNTRSAIIAGRMVYDTLLDLNPEEQEFKPLLATGYRFVDDLTLEFDLREGVKFHNGEPFDADDVVYTFTKMMAPDSGVKSRSTLDWIESVEKIGQYKVRIKQKKPFPAALDYLAGALPIYPNEYYEKVGSRGMSAKPVGTGPYKHADDTPGARLTLVKNDSYFNDSPKGKPQIGKVVFRILTDQNTQMLELMSGQLDWIWRVPADQADQLARQSKLTVKNAQTMRFSYITFASTPGPAGKPSPLNDVKVRQAISHAVDREGIVKSLVRGASQVNHAPCFPTQVGCTQDVTRYDYNPKKAKELLAEAGYKDGFSVDFPVLPGERSFAEAIVGNLQQVGIRANLQSLQYAPLRDKIRSGEALMAMVTWGSYSINDITASTSMFFGGTPDDTARDTQVQEWLATGDVTVDSNARKAVYSKALGRITEQAYWLPLWTHNLNYAFTKDLEFTPSVDEIPRFYATSWK